MSTEPNTQRAIVLTIDECAKQFELYAQSNDGRNIERAHAYRHCSEFLTEFCKQPPPETGAVDVEVVAFKLARSFYGYFEGDSAGSSDAMLYFDNNPIPHLIERANTELTPLTDRISELEKRKDCDCGWTAAAEWEAKANELEKENAELRARVKEMEANLEGALKLTTASSIEHVSKLER